MHTLNTQRVKQVVENITKNRIDPYLKMDLMSADCIDRIEIEQKNDALVAHIDFHLGFPCQEYGEVVAKAYEDEIFERFQIPVVATCTQKIISHKVQGSLKPYPNIKNIIVVSSGKGGVGKSTTAVNLALALKHEGANVGILDADIYGPSIPKMLGTKEKPESKDGKTIDPIMAFGLQTMSIGYLIEEQDAMIWRAPMAVQALLQLIGETNWQDLDYLIVDMPPGTGDIQLTLAQKIPVSGIVVVTTPQPVALLDARKGLNMFKKVNVPILGVIENMSLHTCSKCGHEESIFGSDGGMLLAQEAEVALLGKLPLDIRIRKELDDGNPSLIRDPSSDTALKYRDVALNMAAALSKQGKDYAHKFPNIVVE